MVGGGTHATVSVGFTSAGDVEDGVGDDVEEREGDDDVVEI